MEKWTINKIAEETGFDRRTLKKALNTFGSVDTYTLREFVDAWVRYQMPADGEGVLPPQLEREQTRLTAAKADIAEVERARVREQVIEVETVFRVWENVAVSIRRTVETSQVKCPHCQMHSPLSSDEKDTILHELEGVKDIKIYTEQREFDEGQPAEEAV